MNYAPLETKEIRGITAKSLFWLFSLLMTILTSVIATYYSTNSKMDRVQEDIQTFKITRDIQDAQIKALNLQMQALEIRIVRLETQFQTKN